jgi:hypothetical protein
VVDNPSSSPSSSSLLKTFTVRASTNFPDCSKQCSRPRWECTKINTVSYPTGVRCTLPARADTLGCIIGRAQGMGNVLVCKCIGCKI